MDYAGAVPNARRKYSASGAIRQPGMLTRGNASSSYLGREWTAGLLATVGNPANPQLPRYFKPAEKSAATLNAERVERRFNSGKPCPGCGMQTTNAKTCFCW